MCRSEEKDETSLKFERTEFVRALKISRIILNFEEDLVKFLS